MPKYSSAERSGSDREKNVTRPTLDAKAANAKAPTPSGEDASQKTGTAAMSGRASKARFHWSTLPRLCGTFLRDVASEQARHIRSVRANGSLAKAETVLAVVNATLRTAANASLRPSGR